MIHAVVRHISPAEDASRTQQACCYIEEGDLSGAARAARARFESEPMEHARIARVTALVESGLVLERALRRHTQHVLVSCRGTLGNGDLEIDGKSLFEALSNYARSVAQVASEFCREPHEVAAPRRARQAGGAR